MIFLDLLTKFIFDQLWIFAPRQYSTFKCDMKLFDFSLFNFHGQRRICDLFITFGIISYFATDNSCSGFAGKQGSRRGLKYIKT